MAEPGCKVCCLWRESHLSVSQIGPSPQQNVFTACTNKCVSERPTRFSEELQTPESFTPWPAPFHSGVSPSRSEPLCHGEAPLPPPTTKNSWQDPKVQERWRSLEARSPADTERLFPVQSCRQLVLPPLPHQISQPPLATPPLSAGSAAAPQSRIHSPAGQTCVWAGEGHTGH